MKRIVLPLLALLLGFGLLLPTAARAVLITVDFTVLAGSADPTYAGQSASGSFSFDSSLIPSGGGVVSAFPSFLSGISPFSLTWAGHTFSASDASAWELDFDSAGTLTGWDIGGTISGTSISSGTADFIVQSGFNNFTYSYPGTSFIYFGTLESWSVASAASVPEPATVSLLGLGLLPLGMIRRRKRS